MRGFLLERHPRVTDMLACAFAHVGISLVRVTSLEALLDAADTAGPDEFLIIDLTLDGPDDLGRYAPVLGQAVVPVHIVYRDQAIPKALRRQRPHVRMCKEEIQRFRRLWQHHTACLER